MNLYKLVVDTDGYEVYKGFIVVAYSIPQAFEVMYEYVCKDKNWIPYYLRCSNISIKCLGKFEPENVSNFEQQVLMANYINA